MRLTFRLTIILISLLLVCSFWLSACHCSCDDDDDNDEQNVGLDPEQRAADFTHLVHMVSKYYGPLDWKEELLGFDFNAAANDYLERIYSTKCDMAFFEEMFGFISELQDGHTSFSIPSSYMASLNFDVDLYEGKLIVDRIYNNDIPLEIGDEIVSMDGELAGELIQRLRKYLPSGFELSSRRWATTLVTNRIQQLYPAVESGDVEIQIRHLDGSEETVTLAWQTSGTPYFSGEYEDPFEQYSTHEMGFFDRLQRIELPEKLRDFLINMGKYGHRSPSYDLPDGFVQRLGSGSDEFFSGTYHIGDKTIGLLRVPKMYVNRSSSYDTLENEIIELDQLTDGLVVDIMDNPGGQVSFCNFLSSHLHRDTFPQILFQLRPTLEIIIQIEDLLDSNLTEEERDYLEYLYDELLEAYTTEKRLTDPVSLDDICYNQMMDPATDENGTLIGYSKPIIILINELSISGGDYFPATMKDSSRATLVGYRTAGGGGHVVGYYYEFPYSEAAISLTGSLMYRYATVDVAGYPPTHYIENVGVHPHYEYDYQNLNDLLNGGQPYVDYFTNIIMDIIE